MLNILKNLRLFFFKHNDKDTMLSGEEQKKAWVFGNILTNIWHYKLIALSTVALLIILPIVILQALTQQNTKQHAGNEGIVNLRVSPDTYAQKIGDTFNVTLYLDNPSQKDISAVNMYITYNPSVLGSVEFDPSSTPLMPITVNTQGEGVFKYIAINPNPTEIKDASLVLGTLTFTAKAAGISDINFDGIQITASENENLLAIDKTFNTIGHYTIADNNTVVQTPTPNPTSTPTPIPETLRFSITGTIFDQYNNAVPAVLKISSNEIKISVDTNSKDGYYDTGKKWREGDIITIQVAPLDSNCSTATRGDIVITSDSFQNFDLTCPLPNQTSETPAEASTNISEPTPTSVPPTSIPAKLQDGSICYLDSECDSGFCDEGSSGMTYGYCR